MNFEQVEMFLAAGSKVAEMRGQSTPAADVVQSDLTASDPQPETKVRLVVAGRKSRTSVKPAPSQPDKPAFQQF